MSQQWTEKFMVIIGETTPSNFIYVSPYRGQNLVETLNQTSQGSHFITKHYDGHHSLNATKSIFLQQLRRWLTPQTLMEARFFASLRWSHFWCLGIYFVECVQVVFFKVLIIFPWYILNKRSLNHLFFC